MLTTAHIVGSWIGYLIAIFVLPEAAPAVLIIACMATLALLWTRTHN